MSETAHTRRDFLRTAATAAGGLAIAVHLPGCAHLSRGSPGDFAPNAFLLVTPDDRVRFTLARVEMGQGTMTSETMLVAEELNLDPAELEIEHAPPDAAYKNPEFDMQVTGASSSTRTSYEPLRRAGAVVREALIGAAAAEWGVARSEVRLEGKRLLHVPSGRELRIGAMAGRAHAFVDPNAAPKPRSEWRILGKSRQRLDAQMKVDGTAIYGADPEPPGVEVAVVIHGPFGSKLVSFDADAARTMPGVKAIFAVSTGVAVVADRYPRARKAAGAVRVRWTPSDFSTEHMFAAYSRLLDEDDGRLAREDGDAGRVFSHAKNVIDAEYRLPYVAHATMEPMTATVWVKGDRCELWAPTQATLLAADVAAAALGMSRGDVTVHQTLLGGGFGRKTYGDVIREAAEIAKQRPAPVRLVYSREDDIQRDLYRPASLHRLRAAVEDGKVIAWTHRLVAQSALYTEPSRPLLEELVPLPRRARPRSFATAVMLWAARTFTLDDSLVEGARELPYAIENVKVSYHVAETPVPTGVWRSVGHSFNAFVVETFIDELASLAAKDPRDFRRDLLAGQPRLLGVLELAAAKAGWGESLPPGRALGIAVHASFNSYAAIVAEVSLEGGRPRVDRIVAALDCGVILNPDGFRAQVESGVIFGLSSALKNEAITVENGRVQQSNFHDFEVLRMHECPPIEVHVVESDAPPSGIGEVAVPPTPPAVANALFRLTGKRIYELPIRLG